MATYKPLKEQAELETLPSPQKELAQLDEFRAKIPARKKLGIPYRLELLVYYFDLLKSVPAEHLDEFVKKSLSLKHIHLRDIFLPTSNVRAVVGTQLALLMYDHKHRDLFPFLQQISDTFIRLLASDSKRGVPLFEAFVDYCINHQQQTNFNKMLEKINTFYPVLARRIQKKMAILVGSELEKINLKEPNQTVDPLLLQQQNKARQIINLICANNLRRISNSRYLTVEQKQKLQALFPSAQFKTRNKSIKVATKRQRTSSHDLEMTPLLGSKEARQNPLYDLNAALPVQPTPEDLQHTIRDAFAENPSRHLWFNCFFRSCFPRTESQKPSTDYVKKVANLMQNVNGFFEACSKKMMGPMLEAENRVVQSIQYVFPGAQLDWLFGDVKQRLDEFNRQQKEMELHHVLCLDGNEPSVFNVFYYFIDRSLRILEIDNELKNLLCIALTHEGIKINTEAEFSDLNDLIRGLTIAQAKLALSAQQQLHVLDVIFATIFKYFQALQNETPPVDRANLLRMICMHWWEICRVSPKDVLRHFYQELTHVKVSEIGSTQHLELNQIYVFMKSPYENLTESVPEVERNLRDGLKLMIANEERRNLPASAAPKMR